MAQYDFRSPGGDAGQAIMQILAQRKAEERQAMLDEIMKKNVESQITDRAASTRQQGDVLRANIDQQKFGRAKDIVNMAGAEERVTPETSALLDETGFGGRKEERFIPSTPGIGVLEANELPPDATVGSQETMLKPGILFEQARAAGDERRTIAQMNATERARIEADRRTEREERVTESGNLRRELQQNQLTNSAQIAQAGRENTAAIAAAGRGMRDDAATVKKGEEDQTKKAKQAVAVAFSDSMGKAINDLMTPDKKGLNEGAAGIVGGSRMLGKWTAFLPGTDGANAKAALAQVAGQKIVELMSQMKAQSRTGATGFGALSEKELALLQSAASRLDPNQSDERFLAQLQEVDRQRQKVVDAIVGENSDAAPSAPPASSKFKSRIE